MNAGFSESSTVSLGFTPQPQDVANKGLGLGFVSLKMLQHPGGDHSQHPVGGVDRMSLRIFVTPKKSHGEVGFFPLDLLDLMLGKKVNPTIKHPPKMNSWKLNPRRERRNIYKPSIFGFHVSFLGVYHPSNCDLVVIYNARK